MQVRTIAFYNQQYPYGGGEAVTLNLAQELVISISQNN